MNNLNELQASQKSFIKIISFVVATIITLIAVAITHSYFVVGSIEVSFDIKYDKTGQHHIEEFYVNDFHQEFSRNANAKQDIKVKKDEWTKIAFKANSLKKIRHFKIKFNDKNGNIELKNLVFNNKTIVPFEKINDKKIGDFFALGKNTSFTNNFNQCLAKSIICISSNGNENFIQFKEKNKILPYYHVVHIPELIIFCIVIFTLFYILTRFVVVIKYCHIVSSANVMFLVIITISLVIPTLHLSDLQKSNVENRMLANYKPLFSNNKLNMDFGKQFDSFFNDRFWGRETLYKIYFAIKKFNFLVGKNGNYCKNNGEICFDSSQPINYYNRYKKLPKFLSILQSKLNPKKTYAIFFPNKSKIYCDWSLRQKEKCISNMDMEINKLNVDFIKDSKISLISLYSFFKNIADTNINSNLLYFKDDHHATEYADYLIINTIPEFNKLNSNSFQFITKNCVRETASEQCSNRGQTYQSIYLNRKDKNLHTTYKYLSFSEEYIKCVKKTNIRKILPKDNILNFNQRIDLFTNRCVDNDYKILIIGNSFSENFARVMSTKVGNVLLFRTHAGYNPKAYDDSNIKYLFLPEIMNFKADYVLNIIY